MSQYTAFNVELVDKIAHVQINRPEKINSMNAAFWSEIVEIFQWIDDTDEVRVVVLSGAGKHFSSGIDLMMLAGVANELGKDVGRNARLLRRKILNLQASFNAVDNCRKDTVVKALAVLAKTDDDTVRRVLDSKSAKGAIALVWRAGLSMRVAFQLQVQVMRLAGNVVIPARRGIDFPLTEDEMRWHLHFFGIE